MKAKDNLLAHFRKRLGLLNAREKGGDDDAAGTISRIHGSPLGSGGGDGTGVAESATKEGWTQSAATRNELQRAE